MSLGDLESCETLYDADGNRMTDVDIYYDNTAGYGNGWWLHDLDTGVATKHDDWEECLYVMKHEYKADKIIRRGQTYF